MSHFVEVTVRAQQQDGTWSDFNGPDIMTVEELDRMRRVFDAMKDVTGSDYELVVKQGDDLILPLSNKAIATELLQARVDGKLDKPDDMLTIIGKHGSILATEMMELLAFATNELTNADIKPIAQKVAEKYGLEIIV